MAKKKKDQQKTEVAATEVSKVEVTASTEVAVNVDVDGAAAGAGDDTVFHVAAESDDTVFHVAADEHTEEHVEAPANLAGDVNVSDEAELQEAALQEAAAAGGVVLEHVPEVDASAIDAAEDHEANPQIVVHAEDTGTHALAPEVNLQYQGDEEVDTDAQLIMKSLEIQAILLYIEETGPSRTVDRNTDVTNTTALHNALITICKRPLGEANVLMVKALSLFSEHRQSVFNETIMFRSMGDQFGGYTPVTMREVISLFSTLMALTNPDIRPKLDRFIDLHAFKNDLLPEHAEAVFATITQAANITID